MNETSPPSPARRRPWLIAALVVVVLVASSGWAWHAWQQHQQQSVLQAQADALRLQGLLDSVEVLRRDQRASSARLQDAASTNRVLRDEVLGLGQRSALLEQNVARLADNVRQDSQALHRDAAELLLVQAGQRLDAIDDVEGARRLYALAASQLDDLPPAEGLNLRQALLQESTVLDAAGQGPRADVLQRLAALAQSLDALPLELPLEGNDDKQPGTVRMPWWQKALAPFVTMTPTRLQGPLTEAERVTGREALQVELTLARAAVERGDAATLGLALDRIERGMTRLWPDSPALRRQRAELRSMRSAPLRLAAPELGSTLRQLRSLQDGGNP